MRRRALTDWRAAGLKPIALHECRHTFASLMIAAGVNAKALTTFLGHASIETTFDLYGKLMPGGEAEAAARLDAYLVDASERARAADGPRSRCSPPDAELRPHEILPSWCDEVRAGGRERETQGRAASNAGTPVVDATYARTSVAIHPCRSSNSR